MTTDRIDYAPPPFSRVLPLMSEFIIQLNADSVLCKNILSCNNIDWVSLFNIIGEHHCKFERIHPFEDGNGRTGMLLMIYELITFGTFAMRYPLRGARTLLFRTKAL